MTDLNLYRAVVLAVACAVAVQPETREEAVDLMVVLRVPVEWSCEECGDAQYVELCSIWENRECDDSDLFGPEVDGDGCHLDAVGCM